jgi:uncharacterized membrane protein
VPRHHHLSPERRQQLKEAQLYRCHNPRLADVVERNIDTILEVREEFERRKSRQDRIADAITNFSGSMLFAYLHVVWFGLWVIVNVGWLGIKPFDPFPFGLLTMIVSLEAIFLATFVLVSQNRMMLATEERATLDLQINLLSEYEITRLLTLVDAMADRMGIKEARDPEMDELEMNVAPEVLLGEIEDQARERAEQHARERGKRRSSGEE